MCYHCISAQLGRWSANDGAVFLKDLEPESLLYFKADFSVILDGCQQQLGQRISWVFAKGQSCDGGVVVVGGRTSFSE